MKFGKCGPAESEVALAFWPNANQEGAVATTSTSINEWKNHAVSPCKVYVFIELKFEKLITACIVQTIPVTKKFKAAILSHSYSLNYSQHKPQYPTSKEPVTLSL